MEAEFIFPEADFGCAGLKLACSEQQRYCLGSTACFASANTSGRWAHCLALQQEDSQQADPARQNHLLQPNSLAAIRALYSSLSSSSCRLKNPGVPRLMECCEPSLGRGVALRWLSRTDLSWPVVGYCSSLWEFFITHICCYSIPAAVRTWTLSFHVRMLFLCISAGGQHYLEIPCTTLQALEMTWRPPGKF